MSKEIGAGIASIRAISTTLDGGAKVTLEFGTDSIELIRELLDIKMGRDEPFMVACVAVDSTDTVLGGS